MHLAIYLKMMRAQKSKAAVDSLQHGFPWKVPGGNVKKLIVQLFVVGALLSACTGQIRIHDDHGGNEGGGFCPPGQAKKGNC